MAALSRRGAAAALALFALSGALVCASVTTTLAQEGKTMTTASGLTIADSKIGAGAEAKPGSNCVMHYTGWLYENGAKGTKFDSSLDRGEPFEFPLGAGTASIQGDVIYSDDFCFTTLCAPVEKEKGYTVANARIGYGAPDGRWEVAAWVNNLFEEEYRVYAFDSSLFSGVVAGVYGKPRWYGVTASFRFGAGYN